MKKLLLILFILSLTGCGPSTKEDCKKNEYLTSFKYYDENACVNKDELIYLINYKCINDIKSINRSMSDTWGNNDYNTIPTTQYGYDYLSKCKEEYYKIYEVDF